MYSFGLAIRLYFILFVFTFLLMKLFTYLFHGKTDNMNIADLTVDIVGLLASTMCVHIFQNRKKANKSYKNYLLFYISILGMLYYIYYILIKVI